MIKLVYLILTFNSLIFISAIQKTNNVKFILEFFITILKTVK